MYNKKIKITLYTIIIIILAVFLFIIHNFKNTNQELQFVYTGKSKHWQARIDINGKVKITHKNDRNYYYTPYNIKIKIDNIKPYPSLTSTKLLKYSYRIGEIGGSGFREPEKTITIETNSSQGILRFKKIEQAVLIITTDNQSETIILQKQNRK